MEFKSEAERNKASRLMEAAKLGNLRTLKSMAKKLGKGHGIKATIASIVSITGEGALHWAAKHNQKEICQYLIENLGFNPDLKASTLKKEETAANVKLYSEKTPIHCATFCGSMNTLEYLISIGADLDARDENGFTPLHTAIMQDQVEALRVLASNGAEVDALHFHGPPLFLATAKDDDKMVNILLDHKADPNMNYKEMMYDQFITPLVVSVLNGSMKCTELLVKAGADVNKQPVLEMALGSIDLMNYLLKSGANPNMPNKYGKVPIEVAAIRGLKEAVEILFPLTSPIKTVPDWSVEGLFTHVESESFKNMEKIQSGVKMEKLKEAIEDVINRQGYTTARYLCFYALQEDPSDVKILATKTLCKMRIEKDLLDGMIEIRESKSADACRLLADILSSLGNKGAAALAVTTAMTIEPDNSDHDQALLATGMGRVKIDGKTKDGKDRKVAGFNIDEIILYGNRKYYHD